MRVPDAVPSVGLQLDDLSPGLPTRKARVPSGVGHAAGPVLPDSDNLVRGAAPITDSASYDTDNDFQQTVLLAAKAFALTPPQCQPNGISGANGDSVTHQHGPLRLLCQPFRTAFSGGGEEPQPPSLPNLSDILRHCMVVAWRALLRLRSAALQPPLELDAGASPGGVFRTLLFRQMSLHSSAWEAYSEQVVERQSGPNGGMDRPSIFGLPLLHPRCGLALVWVGAMLIFDCVFTAFMVPVNVAFCLEQYGKLEASCTRTDLAGGIIYLLNLLLNLQIGVTLTHGYRSRVVLDGLDIARLFATSASFWVDVAAVVPLGYLLAIVGGRSSRNHHQSVSIVSLMRLVRLFRVASIIKHLYSSSAGGELHTSWLADHFTVSPLYMVLLVYLAMVLVNLYACILLLLAYYQQLAGNGSWLMSAAGWSNLGPGGGTSGPRRWSHAVYFVITVMTTTGYADFLPRSPGEQVVACVMMLNGLLIFGAMVALIGSVLKRSQEQAQAMHDTRKKLTRIRTWLEEGRVPEKVQRDVIMFFIELGDMRGRGATEGDIVFELPGHLRQKVVRHVVRDHLSRCAPLSSLPAEVSELIASHCVPVDLPTGHELFRLGEEAEGGMWLLEEGMVLASRYQERMEAPAGPTGMAVPCLLGQGALLADAVRACSCRLWTLHTERPCRVWHLRGPAMRAVLQVYPYIVQHYMSYIKSRILAWLAGSTDREDDGWCEVIQLLKRSFLLGPLRDRITDCYLALQLASPQDGTLPQLLNAWLDMSMCRELKAGEQNLDDDERCSVQSVREALLMVTSRAATTVNGGDGPDGVAAAHPTLTPAATPQQQPTSPAAYDTVERECTTPNGSDSGSSVFLVDGDDGAVFELYIGRGTLTSSSLRGGSGRGTAPATPAPTPPRSPMAEGNRRVELVSPRGGREREAVLNHGGGTGVGVTSASLGSRRRRLVSDSGHPGFDRQGPCRDRRTRAREGITSENGTGTGTCVLRHSIARSRMVSDNVIAAAAATLRDSISDIGLQSVDAEDEATASVSLLDASVAAATAAANTSGRGRRRMNLNRAASEGRQDLPGGGGALNFKRSGTALSARTAPVVMNGNGGPDHGGGGGALTSPDESSVLHRALSPVMPAHYGKGRVRSGAVSLVLQSPPPVGNVRELHDAITAAALVQTNPLGHTTFLQKIFLAAGVVLDPQSNRPPSSSMLPVTANLHGGGGGGGTTISAANGLTVTATACTTCGCATCAYCARPIVPQNALAAMRPVVRQHTKSEQQAPSGAPGMTVAAATLSVPMASSLTAGDIPLLRRIYSAGTAPLSASGPGTAPTWSVGRGRLSVMSPSGAFSAGGSGAAVLGMSGGGRGTIRGRGLRPAGPLLRMWSKPLDNKQPMHTQNLLLRSGSGGRLETGSSRVGRASRFGEGFSGGGGSGGGGGASGSGVLFFTGRFADGVGSSGGGGGSGALNRVGDGANGGRGSHPLSPGASLAARAAAVSESNADMDVGSFSGTMGFI